MFPVEIERPFAYSGFPGDIFEGGLVIAIAQDQGRGRIENALCPCLAPLSLGLVPACTSLLLCHASCFLHAGLPSLSSDGRSVP